VGCNTSDILGTAYRNGYAKLSERDLKVAAIAAACSTCNAQPLIEAAIGNGYLKLSEFDVAMCIANALCSSPGAAGAPAPTALSAAIQNHLLSMSRRDLDAVITAVLCKQTNPPCVTPSAPLNSAGSKQITNTTILVTWNQIPNPGSLVTSYTVKWGTVTGVYTNSVTVPAIPKVYRITGLTAGTQYFWIVIANSFTGCSSANSNEGTGTTTGGALGNGLLTGLVSYWKIGGTPDSVDANAFTAHGGALAPDGTEPANLIADSNGLVFSGDSTANLTATDAANLRGGAGVSLSFSLWFKATLPSDALATVFSKWGSANANDTFLLIFVSPNCVDLQLAIRNLANSAGPVVDFGNPAVGSWHHFAGGYDDTNQVAWGQLDGAARLTTACVGVQGEAHSQLVVKNWAAFTQDGGGTAGMGGAVVGIGFWRRVLSTTDVATLYGAGAGLAFGNFTV